jgi:hypothetical protein
VNSRRKRILTFKILVITLIIVASLVVSGAFLGFYLGEVLGISKAILAATISTLGLFISLPIVVKIINWIIRKEVINDTKK